MTSSKSSLRRSGADPASKAPRKSLVVVIPAAGKGLRMRDTLAAAPFGVPKPLLELGRRPVIIELFDCVERWASLSGVEPRYDIVLGAGASKVRRFLRAYYGRTPLGARLRFFTQARPLGPLAGVLAAPSPRGETLVWLCDTLLDGTVSPFSPDSVCTSRVDGDLSRWCLALVGRDGRVTGFVDKPRAWPSGKRPAVPVGGEERSHAARAQAKPAPVPSLGERPKALIGIYHLSDAPLFWRVGRDVMRRGERLRGEFQLSTALEEYGRRRPLKSRLTPGWRDVGSPGNFSRVKELFLERLSTHRLVLDPDAGTIRKSFRGRRPEKPLAEEARWYRVIRRRNPALAASLPERAELRRGELVLSYRDWPSLTDWYLYRSLYLEKEAVGTFRSFLCFVRDVLHRRAPSTAGRRAQAGRFMLLEKTEERLRRLGGRGLLDRPCRLNGARLGSWAEFRPRFRALAERFGSGAAGDWRTIHGDLVLSNVLADGAGRFFLIDPRGSYGRKPGVEGDRCYDYAKIAQCVLSGYDSIKKDEFVLARKGPDDYRLSWSVGLAPGRRLWRDAFLGFCRQERLDMGRLRFFEASLLLSLLPLHRERKDQVAASYLTALSILRGLS